MIKHSKQRDAILTYLHSTKSHPTAETVYENVRESIPNISLGTVYRNLALLEELGEIPYLYGQKLYNAWHHFQQPC